MVESKILVRQIIERYLALLEPIVGRNTTLAQSLTSGLETILREELKSVCVSSTGGTPTTDYLTKTGPRLNDGRRYTAREVLEMNVEEFLFLHPKSKKWRENSLMRYFQPVAYSLGKPTEIKVKDAVAVSPEKARRMKNLGSTSISRVNEYLQKYYGIRLGVRYC